MRWIDARVEDPLAFIRARQTQRSQDVSEAVASLIEDVRRRGDLALLEAARAFDCLELTSFKVSPQDLEEATVAPEIEHALQVAIERVMRFHEAQLYYLTDHWDTIEGGPSRFDGIQKSTYRWTEESPLGSKLGQRLLPVSSAGVYVPGGKATYPSSVIMNCCPANVAMVDRLVITSPAQKNGKLPPAVLVAARLCLVDEMYLLGGASAIAALALGTETIPRVDKVVGPGNMYVNEAKRQLWGSVGLDGFAGPSEVCVVVDDTSRARYAALDFLTQIEHSEDNVGTIVATSETAAQAVCEEVRQLAERAARSRTLVEAMQELGLVVVVRDMRHACDLVNEIAPEHLSLAVKDPESALEHIHNAGAVLLGENTPESAGDYVAGPSHTLPTGGSARFGSPLNVLDFFKFQSVLELSYAELDSLADTIDSLANIEGLPMHGLGATERRQ